MDSPDNQHGGQIGFAARRLHLSPHQILDLSTGINPHMYPISISIPPNWVWRCLPQADDELEASADRYYGGKGGLPVAGSQMAIGLLPGLTKSPCRVAVPAVGYAEHARAWRKAGHRVHFLSGQQLQCQWDEFDVVVVINPNNPTGEVYTLPQLLAWREHLASKGGYLIVDEAFMDMSPECSLVPFSHLPGLIVLRSLGKFFGLAGVRVGFVYTSAVVRQQLQENMDPWPVNGPGRWVAQQALSDIPWQDHMRRQLQQEQTRLASLLAGFGWYPSGGTALFQWMQGEKAQDLYQFFAKQGVLLRYFSHPSSVRIGLPGEPVHWQRLEQCFADYTRKTTTPCVE